MKKTSLRSQIEELLPLDSESQIDKLINVLTERHTSIDCYLEKLICSLIGIPSLVDYYKEKSSLITRIQLTSETIPYLADLLVKYYPVDNATKADAIYDEFTKDGNCLSRSDYEYASSRIIGKGKKQWEKRFNEAQEIKLQVDSVNSNLIISVPQPLASLIVTGAIKQIQIENYYKLHKGDTIYVYADGYSPQMMNKIKYDLNIWSQFCNGFFTGCYNEETFQEKCYVGYFRIGNKVSKGVEEIVIPKVFNSPVESHIHNVPSKLSIPSHLFQMSHVELSNRTIIVPVNEETWSQIEKQEGNTFFYWEEGFDNIIRFKELDEYSDEIWDDEEDEHNSLIEGLAGDEKGLYEILFINGKKQMLYKQKDERAVHLSYYYTKAGDPFKALFFEFEHILPVKEKDSSFDILQKKEWILDWNCVRFKNGLMIVSAPLDGSVKFKPKAVHLPGAMEAYNYLTAYLNDRLAPVHCSVEKMELTIYDTIRLNEAIQKFATISRQKASPSWVTNRQVE